MIEMYKYYARCNKSINAQMIKLIKESDLNVFDYQVGGFYKSIGDILNHYYISDILWMKSFKTIREYSIFKDPIFEVIPKFGERLFNNITEMEQNRTKLDDIITELVNEIREEDLTKIVSRTTRMGEKQEKIFWKCLIHMFNHETHHRGHISQILDQLKIENDYSNMISID